MDESIQTKNIEEQDTMIEEELIDKKKLIEILGSILILIAAALQGLGQSMHMYVESGMMDEQTAKQALIEEINNRNTSVNRLIQSGGAAPISPVQRYAANQALNQPTTNVTGAAETVDALFKIGALTKDLASATIGRVVEESYNLAKDLVGVAIGKLEESILGQQLANLPEGTTAQKINYLSELVNEIAQDPESRQAVINLSKSVANLGIQTLQAIQPQLDELTTQFWTVANGIASKSAVSAATAAISAVMAVIADIPVIGGIIVDMFFAAKTFNTIAETAGYSIQKSTKVFQKAIETLGTAANVAVDNAAPVVQAAQNTQQAVSDVLNKVTSYPEQIEKSIPGIPIYDTQEKQPIAGIPIYGNKSGGFKNNKKKVERIKERIRKTVKKFKGDNKEILKQNKNKKKSRKNNKF